MAGNLIVHRHTHTGERPYTSDHLGGMLTFKMVHKLHPCCCLDCGSRYKQARGPLAHWHTDTGKRLLVCEICSKAFVAAGNFGKHGLMHERNGDSTRDPSVDT